jgi:hypothetical protein
MQDGEQASKKVRHSISSSLQFRSDNSQTGRLKKSSERTDPTRDTMTVERNESISSQVLESERIKFGSANENKQDGLISNGNPGNNLVSPSRKRYFSTVDNH